MIKKIVNINYLFSKMYKTYCILIKPSFVRWFYNVIKNVTFSFVIHF